MNCPRCGAPNPTGKKFCSNCGLPLTAAPPPPPAPTSGWVEETSPHPVATIYPSNASVPATTPPPAVLAYTPPPAPPAASPSYNQPYPAHPPNRPPATTYAPPPNKAAFDIWGPFAGMGERRRHVGWLLNNEGKRVNEVRNQIMHRFKERQIPQSYPNIVNLRARGLQIDQRPYLLIERDLVTMGVYLTNYGRDLYVSLVSYLNAPISNVRVVMLAAMVLFAIFFQVIFPNMLQDAIQGALSGRASAAFLFLCIVGPLGLLNNFLLLLVVLFSIYKYLTAKDALAVLRTSPNEFNADDLMAMEKVVEETVRQSLTDLQLNPDNLRPVTTEQAVRVRLF